MHLYLGTGLFTFLQHCAAPQFCQVMPWISGARVVGTKLDLGLYKQKGVRSMQEDSGKLGQLPPGSRENGYKVLLFIENLLCHWHFCSNCLNCECLFKTVLSKAWCASPENLLEMQISRLHLKPTKYEIQGWSPAIQALQMILFFSP